MANTVGSPTTLMVHGLQFFTHFKQQLLQYKNPFKLASMVAVQMKGLEYIACMNLSSGSETLLCPLDSNERLGYVSLV